jgi:hypothetical protein
VLLHTRPAPLSFQYERDLPRLVRSIAPLTIPVMWSLFPATLFAAAFRILAVNGGRVPTFLFWLVRELVW